MLLASMFVDRREVIREGILSKLAISNRPKKINRRLASARHRREFQVLKLKPNCEACDKNLPAESEQAYICTYECTFCRDCVENLLANVCPNCGGGFCQRPIRPRAEHRKGVSLAHHPASTRRVNSPYSEDEIRTFAAKLKNIPANLR